MVHDREEERDAGGKERTPGEMPAWVRKGGAALRGQGRVGGTGIEFGAAVVVFTLLGYWADRHFGTLPLFLLIGLALGFTGGLVHIVRATASRAPKARDDEKDRKGS